MYPAAAVRGNPRSPLPSDPLGLPRISLELVEDLSPETPPGYLRLIRRRLVAHYPDGTASRPFVYDEVDRRAIDATVIAAHFADVTGARHVYLRSALRPPAYFRDPLRSPVVLPDRHGGLWELPAGLIEPAEQTPEGLRASAARELDEEIGFTVAPATLRDLGPSLYPSPGVIAERHFFFEIEVDPAIRHEPALDGSALEHFGVVRAVALEEALAMCRRGDIDDAKTEIGLRRLREAYS